MQALCAPLSAPELSFAARARIAVEYSGSPEQMPVVRIDRDGFMASVADDAELPPLGLPRPVRVLCGGERLCELRLVARALARPRGRPVVLTMQPSRANDDLSFWRALHACRHLYLDMLGGSQCIGNGPDGPDGSWRSPLFQAVSGAPIVPGAVDGRRLRAASGGGPAASDIRCEAVFELPASSEALFFSEWIEYHFAEMTVLARTASCPADLRDIERHGIGTQVAIVFSYRRGSLAVHSTTDAACAWVAQEMELHFGMSLRYELLLPLTSHRAAEAMRHPLAGAHRHL
jgi:hypothetical protein